MSVNSINYSTSLLGQSVQNINSQLSNLSTELSTGVKSTNYAGMGVDEGFAITARQQLANISAFTDTMTNVNTTIDAANAALQSLSATANQVQAAASVSPPTLTASGQTVGQQTAASELSSIVGILNTQVGNRYIFSGSAINTPSVVSADTMLNGTGTQAGLTQVIAERQQADLGTDGLGRLAISSPAPSPASAASVQVSEDAAGSPFGLKLNSVSSSLTNATVTGPSGSPAGISVDFGTVNPNPGDQITFTFNEPDGTTDSIQLTATNTSPPPTGSFTIGTTPAATASNFETALTSSISTLANTSLVAASAVAAGNDFFNSDTAIGSAVNNQMSPPAAITGNTALSGASGTDSLSSGFAPGDTLTVNGQTITFVASGATGNNQINVTDNVQQLLSKIDAISGTSTPSTVSGGAVTLNTNADSTLSISSSNSAALNALGFSGGSVSTVEPLRVSGSPPGSATALVSDPVHTVEWYTGSSSPGSARASSTVRVDSSQTVQFGAQADEQAIREAVQQIAVFAAVTTPPTGTNSGGQITALSQRIANNLLPQAGQQQISDIQTDFATAQTTMQDVQARQTQTQDALQNLISNTEGIDQNQVASEILTLQTNLQASYQTTAMLSQLSLVKYLPLS